MTDLRSRLILLPALVSVCLVAAAGASAQEDPNFNRFTTPGYPAAATQRDGTTGSSTRSDPASMRPGDRDLAGQRDAIGQTARQGDARSNGTPSNALINSALDRRYEPPPKPTEFQKFVEGATGRLLPIFGNAFFADPANTFAPVDNVPVSSDYTVGPGDEIMLRAWGAIDIDYRTTVDRNGLLNLPKIGSFNVAGVKASELESHLRAQIGRLFTNFELSVSLGQLRGVRVFVVGPARHPGVFTLSSQSTLLSGVVAAGGPAPNGSMRKVLLRRDGRIISELDIYEFLVQGDKSKDVQLAAGDVIVFQAAGARVALNGAFDTPAIFELKTPQEPVRELLRYAGGQPLLANPNRAQLERVDPVQPAAARFVETFRLDGDGLQKLLRDGDVMTLTPISPQFANAVTLRGHVAQPLRYPYQPGMRIRDLIPDPEALITPDFYRRKNLLVQMLEPDDGDLHRTRRSFNANDAGNRTGANDATGRGPYGNGRNDYPTGNNDYGSYGSGAGNGVGGNLATNGDYTVANGATASSRAIGMQANDFTRRGDDRPTMTDASRRPPLALFDELNWDYATIERLNPKDLSTQLISFNLGKVVLAGDDANNFELKPGDVVTIFGQNDIRVPVSRQTRLVSVEGEVSSPGVYQLLPGDTLQALIQRAGGFTPQAYVYGLEFSREETRRRQRENLTAAIARLETLSAVQTARDAANRRDDPVAAATATAVSNAATQAQLGRLRATQPNGRIALELEPEATSLDSVPALPLDGGDRIVVPSRPGFVTVAGAVVNSNAFLWRPGRTAGDYLRLAGADEAAETSNMFILRADGTVKHAGDRRGFLGIGGGIESQVMQPGDALVVPNQIDFETWGRAFVRNLKDFSQIFSGFGIGIAAIHSLNN